MNCHIVMERHTRHSSGPSWKSSYFGIHATRERAERRGSHPVTDGGFVRPHFVIEMDADKAQMKRDETFTDDTMITLLRNEVDPIRRGHMLAEQQARVGEMV